MPCVCRPQRPGRRVGCLAPGLCLPAGDSFGNLRWEWLGAVSSPRLGWGGGAGSPRWRQRPVWGCVNSELSDRPRGVPGAPRHLVCVRPCLSFPSRGTGSHSHLAGGCGSQAGPCARGTGDARLALSLGRLGTPAADRLAGTLPSREEVAVGWTNPTSVPSRKLNNCQTPTLKGKGYSSEG